MMASSLIYYKGLGDIAVATILTVEPGVIYESAIVQTIANLTHLHRTSASTAPGFNQSIACMVAAVGVGHVVAARQGPSAHLPIFAMNLTWAVLGIITCMTPSSWDLGSATLLMSGLNHLAFSIVLYFVDPALRRDSRNKRV